MKTKYFKGSGIIIGAYNPTNNYNWLTAMPCTEDEAEYYINVNKLSTVGNISHNEILNRKDNLVVGQFEYCYKKMQICTNIITEKADTDFLITADNKNGYLVLISRLGYAVIRGHNYVEN